MAYGLQLVTPPAKEPIDVDAAREWCRIDEDDLSQMNVLRLLITAARKWVEDYCQIQLITATWLLTLDRFPLSYYPMAWDQYAWTSWNQRLPTSTMANQWYTDKIAIRLPRRPCQSVTQIQYVDLTGTQQILDPSCYQLDVTQILGRLIPSYGNFWPLVQPELAPVQVTFTAGFGDDPSSVPETLQLAMRALISLWYENRETLGSIPDGVKAMVDMEWSGEYT